MRILLGAAIMGGAGYAMGTAAWPVPFVVPAVALAAIGVWWVAGRSRSEPADASPPAWDDVARELARARRHQHPFALVRFAPADAHRAAVDWSGRLVGFARRTDRSWVDRDDVLVLLPETDHAAADAFVRRARTVVAELASFRAHAVSFPRDGLTGGALLAALYGQTLPSIAVPAETAVAAEHGDLIDLRPHLVGAATPGDEPREQSI